VKTPVMEAPAAEVARHVAERVRDEVRADLEAANAYAARHGSFSEMVRDHYGSGDDRASPPSSPIR
jgi:hypothetical protein